MTTLVVNKKENKPH